MKYILLLLLSWVSASCALSEDAGMVFPEAKEKLFVESYLVPGAPLRLSLIRTNSFQENLSLRLEWYARVKFSTPDTTLVLDNMLYQDTESAKLVNYANAYVLPAPGAGDSIRIQIISEKGQDTLYAATEVVEAIEIKEWSFQNQLLKLSCAHGATAKDRYYSMFVESDRRGEAIRRAAYFDYSGVDSPEMSISMPIPADEHPGRVILYRITAANYRFQEALRKASNSNVDPFEPPIKLPTNIRGGKGIFTYCTTDTLILKP